MSEWPRKDWPAMRSHTDETATSKPRVQRATLATPFDTKLDRFVGADVIRFVSLLSILLFHIVLRDSQFAAATAQHDSKVLDALLCISSVFDNRSMAVLSLFLLIRHRTTVPYASVIRERAHRLLVPYLAWTLIYPFLDLAIAAIAGRPQPALARILDVHFWVSGILLATITEHLHFLPTLFVLTLLWPIYRNNLSIGIVMTLIIAASAMRTVVEFFVIVNGDVYSAASLATLNAARIVEYLPIGFLAFSIAKSRIGHRSHRVAVVVTVLALLGGAIVLQPARAQLVAPGGGLFIWTIAQSILSALIFALAAAALLTVTSVSPIRSRLANQFGLRFARVSLGIFLIHPFFCDLFDVIVKAPRAFEAAMVLPKFVFVLICSFFTASFFVSNRRFATIV